MDDGLTLRVRFAVDDVTLSALHDRAFGSTSTGVQPWATRLARHALTWVGAFDGAVLVGFVQLGWDGGAHAFLLDTAVDPARQRRGVGGRWSKPPWPRRPGPDVSGCTSTTSRT